MTSSVSLQILSLALVAGLGLIPAIVAGEKGRSFGRWWLYGALFFPVAFPHAILAEEEPRFVRRRRLHAYAAPRSWNSCFCANSAVGNHGLGNSWTDLGMQQSTENSSVSPTPAALQPEKTVKPGREPRQVEMRPGPRGNSNLARWSFDDRDIHIQPDIDRPTWRRKDYGGIRFPFISIVSVLALTMLVTAGAYEIAAGGWAALSRQIATIESDIERVVPPRFETIEMPALAGTTLPAVEEAVSFPLPKPVPVTRIAAISPAAGPTPQVLPQQAAIPPQPETLSPQPKPAPEKSVQTPTAADSLPSAPASHSGAKSERIAVSRDVVKHVQKSLRALGYAPGRIDGKIGDETRDAIRLYQTHKGLAATGVIDRRLLRSLGVKTYAKSD